MNEFHLRCDNVRVPPTVIIMLPSVGEQFSQFHLEPVSSHAVCVQRLTVKSLNCCFCVSSHFTFTALCINTRWVTNYVPSYFLIIRRKKEKVRDRCPVSFSEDTSSCLIRSVYFWAELSGAVEHIYIQYVCVDNLDQNQTRCNSCPVHFLCGRHGHVNRIRTRLKFNPGTAISPYRKSPVWVPRLDTDRGSVTHSDNPDGSASEPEPPLSCRPYLTVQNQSCLGATKSRVFPSEGEL